MQNEAKQQNQTDKQTRNKMKHILLQISQIPHIKFYVIL